MNKRMTAHIVGKILLCEAAFLLAPALVALVYAEWIPLRAMLISAAIVAAVGFALSKIPVKTRTIYSREGFVAVALSWIAISLGGSLPFILSGEIPSFVDALFEIVSGFTTTGASILTDVEAMSRSLLFWRSFSHWIGGMGVLVFVMTALPLAGGGGNLHLMRAESPGPDVSKLVPTSRGTAVQLYSIYIAMTVLQYVLMLFAGNDAFDALLITFGTAGTGGFATMNSSLADYNTATQIIVTVFMAAFGINFSCYFLLINRKAKELFRNEELRAYIIIMVAAIVLVTVNIYGVYGSVGESLKHAAFQVSSVMTTTGFATADFNLWPEFSRMVMLLVMCIGACVGSTGGGIKVARVLILVKEAIRRLRSSIVPSRVESVRMNGKPVGESMITGIATYFILYMLIAVASVLVLSLDRMDTVSNISGVIATLNNIGPGLEVVGAVGNYSSYSALSKCVFIFDMLAGRLEILPVLALFSRRTWR